MHELDADGAAVDAAGGVGFFAFEVEVGLSQRREVPDGIEIGLEITPAAERVHHAFQLLAVNIHQCGGQG